MEWWVTCSGRINHNNNSNLLWNEMKFAHIHSDERIRQNKKQMSQSWFFLKTKSFWRRFIAFPGRKNHPSVPGRPKWTRNDVLSPSLSYADIHPSIPFNVFLPTEFNSQTWLPSSPFGTGLETVHAAINQSDYSTHPPTHLLSRFAYMRAKDWWSGRMRGDESQATYFINKLRSTHWTELNLRIRLHGSQMCFREVLAFGRKE